MDILTVIFISLIVICIILFYFRIQYLKKEMTCPPDNNEDELKMQIINSIKTYFEYGLMCSDFINYLLGDTKCDRFIPCLCVESTYKQFHILLHVRFILNRSQKSIRCINVTTFSIVPNYIRGYNDKECSELTDKIGNIIVRQVNPEIKFLTLEYDKFIKFPKYNTK